LGAVPRPRRARACRRRARAGIDGRPRHHRDPRAARRRRGGGVDGVSDDREPTTAPSLLIVDDDEVFRTRLARAFAERGYEVRAASGHAEALALARAESPEMAILDLRMPGPSGLELVRDLKALDPSTRILVLTGYGSIATAIDAMRIGATYYLPK